MKYVFILCISFFSGNLLANEYKTEINEFFTLYKEGQIDEAVDSIYKTNSYVSSIPDQIKGVKNQLSALTGLVGELHHISHVHTYDVGGTFVHVTYLLTYDRQPIRFEFQFFKVKSGWRVYAFSFDDNMDDEIEALARKAAIESNN
tara:strand:- start:86 stop:523 length:438 start_codon:yes stop_codon:yes gene_type:complete